MRVSLCKIQWSHCPSRFICFCTKSSSPSSTPLHKPPPTTPPPPAPVTKHIKVDNDDDDEKKETHHDLIDTHVADSIVGSIPDPIGTIGLLSAGGDCGGGDGGVDDSIGCREGCSDEDKGQEKEQSVVVAESTIKSSLRNKDLVGSNGVVAKKSVQWMDFLGKELVEINEFESSDGGYSDDEGMTNRGCLCNVL